MKIVENSPEIRNLLLIGVFYFCCVCGVMAGNREDNKDAAYSGRVVSGDKGISGVVVTDGANFAVTDRRGKYQLPFRAEATHIYISSPAGFSVPVKNSVPLFWVSLRELADKGHIDFNLIRQPVSDVNHVFVAVGDPQVRNKAEVKKLEPIVETMAKDVAGMTGLPVHVMIAGDLVFNKPGMHDDSKACFSKLNLPVYNAIGNHDYVFDRKETPDLSRDEVADSVYIRHYGPTDYSFNRGEVHYLVLDNIRFKGGTKAIYDIGFTSRQLAWVKKDLSYVSRSKALVVMFHSPSKSRYAETFGNCEELRNLLQGFAEVQILSGHTHYNAVVVDDSGIVEHILGAACGGFWEGPVCSDGTLLGYKIFEVKGTQICWAYRAYAENEAQFSVSRPEQRASVLRPSNELLVNVWDWDPAWKVTYSEDGGISWKRMDRITEQTFDPTAFRYFGMKGDQTIPGRSFIGARLTDHIFNCVPAEGVRNVVVKTVSRFGKEYTRLIEL